MAELALDRDLRLALKAQAHGLDPVVLLGLGGLTEAVIAEVDRALVAHSLIKVRVPSDDRTKREAIFATIADRLGAARVQSIGKVIVLYRPPPPEETPEPPERTDHRARKNDPPKPDRRRHERQR